MSEYINHQLNPSKFNIYDDTREDVERVKSIDEILDLLHIPVDEYHYSLAISEDGDFQIHLRRPPNSCFVKIYFKIGLSARQVNMDIQPVFNEHKAIAYMFEASLEIEISIENQDSSYEQMKGITQAYASNRECSIQEALYHCLPQFWLRKVFPGLIFANTNIPENRFIILLTQQEICELTDESEGIFKNMLGRYLDRRDEKFQNGKLASVNFLC